MATRTQGRFEIIEYACKNGVKGLYLEKPIARSLKELKIIKNSIEKNQVNFVYGAQRRFMDLYIKAKAKIDEGIIGEINEVHIGFGRSLLLWVHPYSVDMILYFIGSTEIDYVQGSCEIPKEVVKKDFVDSDPILNFGFVRFKNGSTGVISSQTSINGMNASISGSEGIIYIFANGSKMEVQLKKKLKIVIIRNFYPKIIFLQLKQVRLILLSVDWENQFIQRKSLLTIFLIWKLVIECYSALFNLALEMESVLG